MAITFEEKNNVGKQIAAFVVFIALVAAVGFLGWKLLQTPQAETFVPVADKVQIDKEVLADPRIVSLELFPEIPSATIEAARENPFVKDRAPAKASPAAVASDGANASSQ